MAMTLPLSPAAEASQSASTSTGATTSTNTGASDTPSSSTSNSNNTNTNSTNNNNNNNSNNGDVSPTASSSGAAASASGAQMKRKPSRRANTAERRATHNAVERQRRETLNGRFLDLAALLPNLSQIRRPSKSSIVNSSIAHIHASRRHRLLASTQLRTLKNEADALRREINEWRDRAGIPRIEEPVRGEAFGMILSGELELVGVVGEEEDGEDGIMGDEDGFGPSPGQYMDGVEEDNMVPMTAATASYGQQVHPGHQHVAMQLHHQHPQHQQHAQQIGPYHHGHPGHHLDDLDDPRIAAMLMKNSSQNPFAHNLPPNHHQHPQQQRAEYYTNYRQGGPGFGPQPGPYNGQGQLHQQHLFTPPATSHGLPPSAAHMHRPSTANTALSGGSHSGSPSPVAGGPTHHGASPHLSLNTAMGGANAGGSAHSSPVSTSSLDGGIMVPPNTAVSPIGLSGASAFESRNSVSPSSSSQAQSQPKSIPNGRGRSASMLSVGSSGASPSYELASHGYDVDLNIPRRAAMVEGGNYMMNGMMVGNMSMNGMHHGYAHGPHGHSSMSQVGMNPNMIGVGGGHNGNAMMMMM